MRPQQTALLERRVVASSLFNRLFQDQISASKAEDVAKVLAAKGQLPVTAYLRCRVRYFCDGAVFGGREFVDGIFQAFRERFGPKRKTGARPVRGLAGAALFTARDLRRSVFGPAAAPP